MNGIFIAIPASFVLAASFVALVLHVSHKKSWYDPTDERKVHNGDIPRLGGLGFASAFIAVAFITNFFASEEHFGLRFLPVLFAMLLILVCGVYDDFRPLSPRIKLGAQIIAGFCVILPGYAFHQLVFPDISQPAVLRGLRYPISLLWLVGITNAINLIDGVDGLAGGVSALIALSYAAVFASFANTGTVTVLCICLAAAVGGFLVFNLPFPRAKIFMGDGGAYFLGFILALLPLIDEANVQSEFPLLYAAALLQIPIFDTFAAIWRRLRDGRRIDSPDRSHFHHKLMNLGLKGGKFLLLVYTLQIILGALVFFSIRFKGLHSLLLLGAAYLIGSGFFITIHFLNQRALKQYGPAAPAAP